MSSNVGALFMITSRLCGGSGNQLFQWAIVRSLQLDTNIPRPEGAQYDISWFDGNPSRCYVLDAFGLKLPLVRGYSGRIIDEGSLRFRPEILMLSGDFTLRGYWQCEKYFQRIEHRIRREVFDGVQFSSKTLEIQYKILANPPSAFLHVRRSDNRSPGSKAFHGLLDLNYYNAAANYIRSKVPGVHFYIFSDEPNWCKENFQDNDITIVDHNSWSGTVDENGSITKRDNGKEHEDMYLMSLCSHGVVANSSFSWWGAWLNSNEGHQERIIIAPKAWFVVGPDKADSIDIIPDRWIRL